MYMKYRFNSRTQKAVTSWQVIFTGMFPYHTLGMYDSNEYSCFSLSLWLTLCTPSWSPGRGDTSERWIKEISTEPQLWCVALAIPHFPEIWATLSSVIILSMQQTPSISLLLFHYFKFLVFLKQRRPSEAGALKPRMEDAPQDVERHYLAAGYIKQPRGETCLKGLFSGILYILNWWKQM